MAAACYARRVAWCRNVVKNQPRRHCGGEMRNATAPPRKAAPTRWRCKQCGASSVKRRNDITNAKCSASSSGIAPRDHHRDIAKQGSVAHHETDASKWLTGSYDAWPPPATGSTAGYSRWHLPVAALIVAATIDHVRTVQTQNHRDYQLLLERIEPTHRRHRRRPVRTARSKKCDPTLIRAA